MALMILYTTDMMNIHVYMYHAYGSGPVVMRFAIFNDYAKKFRNSLAFVNGTSTFSNTCRGVSARRERERERERLGLSSNRP